MMFGIEMALGVMAVTHLIVNLKLWVSVKPEIVSFAVISTLYTPESSPDVVEIETVLPEIVTRVAPEGTAGVIEVTE
jgi:hypothetical protein